MLIQFGSFSPLLLAGASGLPPETCHWKGSDSPNFEVIEKQMRFPNISEHANALWATRVANLWISICLPIYRQIYKPKMIVPLPLERTF